MRNLLALLVIVAALPTMGCGGPSCGNGALDPGETEQTCCQDTGCRRGACDPSGRCVDGWALDCPTTLAEGSCSTSAPGYVCQGSYPPKYDCTACGCGAGQSCQTVCQPDDLAGLVDDSLGISTSLPIPDYFAFIDEGVGGDLTFPQLVAELDKRLAADARRSALLLGESHGSDDEQVTARQLVRDLKARGWTFGRMGIEGGNDPIFDGKTLADAGVTPFAINGDFTNKAYCTAITREAGMLLNDDQIYLQYTGSGHTSREVCYHPEHYSLCQPPHAAECLQAVGRKALVVILFDPEPWLTTTDQALLWRAGNLLPDTSAFDAELTASLVAWDMHLSQQQRLTPFDTSVDVRKVNVRVRAATHADDTFIAYFPRPDRVPLVMKSYQAVWNDAAGKPFLVGNQIRPQDCSIGWDSTPGAEKTFVNCDKAGKVLSATLDGKTFAIEELTTM